MKLGAGGGSSSGAAGGGDLLQFESVSSSDGVEAIVQVVGQLDASTAEFLLREVTRLRQSGAVRILVDLDGVTALDQAGVDVLLHIRRQMHYEEGVFGVIGFGDRARAGIRAAGVAEVLGCD